MIHSPPIYFTLYPSLSLFIFHFSKIITQSRQASCVSLSVTALVLSYWMGFCCFFVFFFFPSSLYQFNSFPFYKVSADVDRNTLQQLSKSNCICVRLFSTFYSYISRKGFIMPDAFISARVLP